MVLINGKHRLEAVTASIGGYTMSKLICTFEGSNRYITYTSDNGYTGILYGESSFSIRDSSGHEVLHTGSRSFNNIKDLMTHVDDFPRFREVLLGISVGTQGSDTE